MIGLGDTTVADWKAEAERSPHGWRVGRSLGRTVYRVLDPANPKGDQVLGMLDTRELASFVVDVVNATLRVTRAFDAGTTNGGTDRSGQGPTETTRQAPAQDVEP